jgi:hypothetical protein
MERSIDSFPWPLEPETSRSRMEYIIGPRCRCSCRISYIIGLRGDMLGLGGFPRVIHGDGEGS